MTKVKKPRKKREHKPKKEKVAHHAFKPCVELYKWFIEGNKEKGFEGITKMAMQFDGGDGKGLNTIIRFIENSIKLREQNDEVEPQRIISGFEFVLKNYHRWSEWHQERTRMKQIAAEFSNITNSLRKKVEGINGLPKHQRAKELLK